MVEEIKDNPGNSDPKEAEGKLYTEAEVKAEIEKHVKSRVDRLNAQTDDKIAAAVAVAVEEEREKIRVEQLQGEDKLKATYEGKLKKQTADLEKTAQELKQARAELSRSRAEAQLASLELPTELAPYVIGENDDRTTENIKELSDAYNAAVAKGVSEAIARGTPKLSTNPESGEDELTRLKRIAHIA